MDRLYRRYTDLCEKAQRGARLSDSERLTLDELTARCPEARLERELMSRLESLDVQLPPASDQDIVSGALSRMEEADKVVRLRPDEPASPQGAVRAARDGRSRAARLVWWSSGLAAAAAAAAAIALSIWAAWPGLGGQKGQAKQLSEPPGSTAAPRHAAVAPELVLTSGEVRVDGQAEVVGARVLSPGSRIEVGQGRACLTLHADSDLCLDAESTIVIARHEGAPVVRVERGEVAVVVRRSKKAPEPRPLVLVIDDMRLYTIKSAYVVAVQPGHGAELRVRRGEVSVRGVWGGRDSTERRVLADQSVRIEDEVLSSGGAVTQLQQAADARRMRGSELWVSTNRDDAALGRMLVASEPPGATVSIDGIPLGKTPLGVLAHSTSRRVEVAREGFVGKRRDVVLAAGEQFELSFDLQESGPKDAEAVRPARAAQIEDVVALLDEARSATSRGQWQAATHAYRQIISHYPKRPESRTILVTLGQLELDRLGQPARALSSFQSYLRAGGSLSREARLGSIRALRRLGRTADEARAIDGYLTRHPTGAEAERLRTRMRALRAQ